MILREHWRTGVLALACAAQLGATAEMVWRSETALETGSLYRFEVEPVDPLDLFRGRYVSLRFAARYAPTDEETLRAGERVFATLEVDDAGFARFVSLSRARPTRGDYLEVEVTERSEGGATVQPTFDRFYMHEEKAPAAERALRFGAGRAHVRVRVDAGTGVIEDLVIDDRSAAEFWELEPGE